MSMSMNEAHVWCQTQDATLLIHWDQLPDADKRAIGNRMTRNEPYWIGIKKSGGTYLWADGTEVDSAMFDGGEGWCAALTSSGQSLRLRKKRCNINQWRPAQTKFICQRANCPNSAGWYSLFNICVWVSTRQETSYTPCNPIRGQLLRWQLLDAGKKYLLRPPLVRDEPWWYTVDGGDCCCMSGPCPALCTRTVARVSSWGDGHCNSNSLDFICESDPASIPTPAPPRTPVTTRIPTTIFIERTMTPFTTTTPAPSTTPSTSTTLISTSTSTATPTSTRPPSSDGTSSKALPSTTMLQSTRSTGANTEVTTSSQGRNVSESGTYAPQVADDNSTVASSAGGGVAALVLLVAVAAVVAVMLYRRKRAWKDAPIEPSSAAAFHNAVYVDPATVIPSDPHHGPDPGQGVYSLATRPLPAQPICAPGGGGDGNTYDNINGSLLNGNSVASNGHVVSSSSARNGMVDNALYSTVNKDKSKEQGTSSLSVSNSKGGRKEDNVVHSAVDKDKAEKAGKGHNRNTTKSADKSFYRPDSTEMVMSENTDYVSGDDRGISTSEADYSEVKGSGRNMAELTHIEHPKSSNTRPDSTELLMSENTLYGDGSRNDRTDPADTDYYNVRGTENNMDSQTNLPATKSADRPDENEYYNVTGFQSHNANSDIRPQCRESFGLRLEENDVYCSGN